MATEAACIAASGLEWKNGVCVPCEPGSFKIAGNSNCERCEIGYVTPLRQSSECELCGNNTLSSDPTNSFCECNIGYYLDDINIQNSTDYYLNWFVIYQLSNHSFYK